jgi:phosphatidylglycerol---prolipoprotein diacylglyceryl transferase
MLSYVLYFSLLYCFLIFYTLRRSKKLQVSTTIALDIGLILMVCGFVGARLMHVLFEEPQYYLDHWTRIFQFWAGGFVFFGGFILALFGATIYVRRKKESWLKWADFYAPIGALGYGLGRIGCLLAGCCYGRYCEFPWAITLAWDSQQIPRHPTQLYAVFFELAIYVTLLAIEKRKIGQIGTVFFVWTSFHAAGRLMMEYFRDDFRGPSFLDISVSSWISLVLIGLSIAALAISNGFHKKK